MIILILKTNARYINEQINSFSKIKINEAQIIQNNDNENIILYKLRKIYDDNINKLNEDELNNQLIILDNRKLSINSFKFSELTMSVISLAFSVLAIILTIYNIASDLGKYTDNLIGNTTQKLESIKSDIPVLKNFFAAFPSMIFYASLIIIVVILFDVIIFTIEKRRKIAINMHRSVIKGQLKKIEEKMQIEMEKSKSIQNEQLILELKEIQMLLKDNGEGKTIIKKACNKIIDDIF